MDSYANTQDRGTGGWKIAQRPSMLSASHWTKSPSGMKPSYSFPSPLYSAGSHYSGYYSRHSVSSTYSRHDQQMKKRLSYDLTTSPRSPRRVSSTHWPVRPYRSSVSSSEGMPLPAESTTDRPSTSLTQEYSDLLCHPERGIPTQERIVAGNTQRVFTGADALEWFPDNMIGVTSVEKAKEVGTQLLRAGLIVNISGQGNDEFYGSPNSLYQFSVKDSRPRPDDVDQLHGHTHPQGTDSTPRGKRGSHTCTIQ